MRCHTSNENSTDSRLSLRLESNTNSEQETQFSSTILHILFTLFDKYKSIETSDSRSTTLPSIDSLNYSEVTVIRGSIEAL